MTITAPAPAASKTTEFRVGLYSIMKFEKWNAREGQGYNMTVKRDGKKVFEVHEEGNGGEVRYNPIADPKLSYEKDEESFLASIRQSRVEIAEFAKFASRLLTGLGEETMNSEQWAPDALLWTFFANKVDVERVMKRYKASRGQAVKGLFPEGAASTGITAPWEYDLLLNPSIAEKYI